MKKAKFFDSKQDKVTKELASEEHFNELKMLVDKGEFDVNFPYDAFLGMTPLGIAVCMNNFKMMELLLDKGADPRAINQPDRTLIEKNIGDVDDFLEMTHGKTASEILVAQKDFLSEKDSAGYYVQDIAGDHEEMIAEIDEAIQTLVAAEAKPKL